MKRLCNATGAYLLGIVALLNTVELSKRSASWAAEAKENANSLWVYVGTYTRGASKGIYRLELDLKTGKLSAPSLAGKAIDPSFLAIHPSRRFLYAVNEIDKFQTSSSGAISAFAIDPKTGDLTLLNQESSRGAGPCHVVVDQQGRHVLAANYGGGSVCVLPILADGRLAPASSFIQHRGSGPNPKRQEGPHAHSINLDQANRFAFVADLGLDRVFIYKYGPSRGTLTAASPDHVAVPPNSGPRHFTFHPDNRHAYVINELASTITAFDYDANSGVLTPIQTISTLPEGFKGENSTADIHVHPSGKFLYGSNRDKGNSIAIFAIDPQTGKLTPRGHQSHRVKTPRNFGIDPTGAYLLVASQSSNEIVVFRINQETGALAPTGSTAEVPVPVCLQFMPKGS
jgi:6-phosphogluconolactonase